MSVPDVIEFYDGAVLVAYVKSSMVPPVGSKISIKKKVWSVVAVTYAVDYAESLHCKGMRANVDLKPATQAERDQGGK